MKKIIYLLLLLCLQNVNASDISGSITKTISAGRYTYFLLDNGKWGATTQKKLKKGMMIVVQNPQIMTSFYSKSLKKRFDKIIFTPEVKILTSTYNTKASSKYKKNHISKNDKPHMILNHYKNNKNSIAVKKGDVKKLKKGFAIAELFKKSKSLKGKMVNFRAKIVKINSNIMGKTWIHVSDGSTLKDLVVTTTSNKLKLNIGKTAIFKGVLKTNIDFGYGYLYKVIIENGKIKL